MKGIALILTVILVALAMAIVLGLTGIFISSLIASRNIHFSTIAFYVADSGIEGALYGDRIGVELADGFTCNTDGPQGPGDNENGDTCLNQLDNTGFYQYRVIGISPARKILSKGRFQDVERTVEVNY